MKQSVTQHYRDYSPAYELWSGPSREGYHMGLVFSWRDLLSMQRMLHNLVRRVYFNLNLGDKHVAVTHVLDAGCGSGAVARKICDIAQSKELRIDGVTISEAQVEIARDHEHTQVEIQCGTFERLTCADATYDAAYFVESMCYGQGADKDAALKEVARAVRSGGRIVVSDLFAQKPERRMNMLTQAINRRISDLWGVTQWAQEDVFRAACDRHGLRMVAEEAYFWQLGVTFVPMSLHIMPRALARFVRGDFAWYHVWYLMQFFVLAPLLGVLRGSFRYKIFVLEKE